MKKLIARFHDLAAIPVFKKDSPALLVHRLHSFSPETNFDRLSSTEKNLYATVLIEVKPDAPGLPEEIIDQTYAKLIDYVSRGVAAYVHFDLPYRLCLETPVTESPVSIPPQDPDAWWVKAINATEALKAYQSRSSEKIKIAVIDTGILHSHPDLDDFGNGGIAQDFTALEWVDSKFQERSIRSIPFSDKGSVDKGDYEYHGTHVAGIIGAILNEGTQVYTTGIAHQETLLNLRAWGTGKPSDASLAIVIRHAATTLGARVINASWGRSMADCFGESSAVEDVIQSASCDHGVVFVCAAGNKGEEIGNFVPARSEYAITVGSIAPGPAGKFIRHPGSNFGAKVIGAPGDSILSLDSMNQYALRSLTGTSMAAPFVAGLAARMLASNPNLIDAENPGNTALTILGAIVKNATGLSASEKIGLGIIDVDRTLGLAPSPNPGI